METLDQLFDAYGSNEEQKAWPTDKPLQDMVKLMDEEEINTLKEIK